MISEQLVRRKKDTLTCQLAAVLTGYNHHPVPLDGDGRSRAGQVGDVGDGDHQDVAGSLKKKRKKRERERILDSKRPTSAIM